MSETRKQYSARKLRVALEQAKRSVIDAQEVLNDYLADQNEIQQLTAAALRRLDNAWASVAAVERAEARRVEARGELT